MMLPLEMRSDRPVWTATGAAVAVCRCFVWGFCAAGVIAAVRERA